MTTAEIRARSVEEMKDDLKELEDGLFGLKFQLILGQLEDTTLLNKNRKDIARIKTVLHERELGIRD